MWRHAAGKSAQYALVLIATITLNFLLPRMMPGSPLAFLAGGDVGLLTPEQRAQFDAFHGLDQPPGRQFVTYISHLARGQFGYSFQRGRPVAAMLGERLPWTLLLVGLGLAAATAIGVALGALAAWRRGSAADLASFGAVILFESVPSFWLGMIFIAVFAARLGWLPIFGAGTAGVALHGWANLADRARHLTLPLTTLVLVTIPTLFLTTRYSMLSVLGERYIATARAKGVPDAGVLRRHAVRNALLPVATVFMLNLGFIVGGATVIETVFSYPGIGRLLYEAVLNRDYPVIQGAFLVITFSVIVANLFCDLLYPLIDPRVRAARS
jgi:peptide/nickel transport system permease protein